MGRHLKQNNRRRLTSKQRRGRRLSLESLENRNLLACTIWEDFESVTPSNLPNNWATHTLLNQPVNDWITVTGGSHSAPNHAFVANLGSSTDSALVSPVITLAQVDPELRFQHEYDTESGFDGGVLELSINGGAFQDVVDAGGTMVSGDYVSTITGASSLAGRPAWSGMSDGFVETQVELPVTAAGQDVQFRWRFASDNSAGGFGWKVDSIQTCGDAGPEGDFDYGDAPASYPTLFQDGGALHDATGPRLGSLRDSEPDGQPDDHAQGDDGPTRVSDEDGVTFARMHAGQLDASVQLDIQNLTDSALVDVWIDFNADGSWDGANEHVLDSVSVSSDGVVTHQFDVPSSARPGRSYARVRINSADDLGPRGMAADGEVEDHAITIERPAVNLGFFNSQTVVDSTATGAGSVAAADLNNDGRMDLVSAPLDLSEIRWYEGTAQGFTSHSIFIGIKKPLTVATDDVDGDVDGDGDVDLLASFTSSAGGNFGWYENDGSGSFTEHLVATSFPEHNELRSADVDGDGDTDFVSTSRSLATDKLAWFENDGSQSFTEHLISANINMSDAIGGPKIQLADMNNDGHLDIITASYFDNRVAWFQNDGSQSFTQGDIITTANGARAVYTSDISGNGSQDVVVVSSLDNRVTWYANDGTGLSFTTHVITTTAEAGTSVFPADVNGDGHMDLLVGSYDDDKISLFQNDGSSGFVQRIVNSPDTDGNPFLGNNGDADGVEWVLATDIDADGDLDVVSASQLDDKIAFYENDFFAELGDAPAPHPTNAIDGGAYHFAIGPQIGTERDTERDASPHIQSQGDDLDGQPDDEDGVTFGTAQVGSLSALVTVNVDTADLEEIRIDGWIDFNGDGSWEGPGEHVVSEPAVGGDNVLQYRVPEWAQEGETNARFRVSLDGNLGPAGATLSGEVEDYSVTIEAPTASSGYFDGQQIVTSSAGAPRAMFVADMDNDGLLDVIGPATSNNKVSVYYRDAILGWVEHEITGSGVDGLSSLYAEDINRDGRLDIISASENDDKITWYENIGGGGVHQFAVHNIGIPAINIDPNNVVNGNADSPTDVFAADLDRDGDLDVVFASSADNKIGWYENIDGAGTFGQRQVITTQAQSARSVYAADVNGDSHIDILSASFADDKISWYHNDGQKNFTELVVNAQIPMAIHFKAEMATPIRHEL
ncbi:MAG: hypothetical protein ACI9G1_001666 [Pirellulaceae bacterium]|jgi:hypothetical protein